MIKFDVLNRFTGSVQFTAEIDCTEDEERSVKIGLSVRWALKNGAYLRGANLGGAYLGGAYLRGAYLEGAYLRGANLEGAYLEGAYLGGAYLRGAYLEGANLRGAYLEGANLRGANLEGANLRGANLEGAYLGGANLGGAYLGGAYLEGANLGGAHGVNEYIKCIQVEKYPITYTSEVMQIGCQNHAIDDWREFSDAQIRAMDGRLGLEWWKKWKDWIFKAIELAPATPTIEASK